MLSPGNTKLGTARLIWTFSLPSVSTCPGRSPACERLCYSRLVEARRPSVRRRYELNLSLSRSRRFAPAVVTFIRLRQVEVVRLHVGGDFYSAEYARKWLLVMRRCPPTRFYFYTRSWKVPAVGRVLARMAKLPNVRAWFSCDRDTGVPARVPAGVRLAWLMASPGDPPPRADLVFRAGPLRRLVQKYVGWRGGGGRALVCPVENGATGRRTSCERCGVCWRPPPPAFGTRVALPVVAATQ